MPKPPATPEREVARRRLAAALAAARRFRARSQSELAAALGVSQATVLNWEAARGEPGALDLLAAARFLEVELAALLGERPLELSAGPGPGPEMKKETT